MILEAIRTPKVLDQIDPSFLADIYSGFPEQHTGTGWRRNPAERREASNPELLEALTPLTTRLLEEVVHEPWGIALSVNTKTVHPQESQLLNNWHTDVGNRVTMMVADILPTEFLVASSAHHYLTALRLLRSVRKHTILPEDDEVRASALTIHTPQPYELVTGRGYIHRSPINHSDSPVPRTWIRAVIYESPPSQEEQQ